MVGNHTHFVAVNEEMEVLAAPYDGQRLSLGLRVASFHAGQGSTSIRDDLEVFWIVGSRLAQDGPVHED